MRHVGFETPRQRVAAADDAVLGNGGEEDDIHSSLELRFPKLGRRPQNISGVYVGALLINAMYFARNRSS